MDDSNSKNDNGVSAVRLPKTLEDGYTTSALNIIISLEKRMPFPALVALLPIEEIDD